MKSIIIFALLLSPALASAAGGYVGNGGDGIDCKKDPANRFDGIYALDYLVTLPNVTGDDGLAKVASWNASAKRITSLLRKNAPSLAQSFEHFTKLLYNTSFREDRIWEPSPFGLVKLDDQRLTSLLPSNCKVGSDPMIMQAVIRLYEGFSGTTPGHIVYKYDPTLLARIEKKDPIQISFLFVHEWLWDVSPNVERNRRVNRFLHSKDVEKLSATDFIAELKGMGLQIPTLQSDDFDEASCQGYAMTEKELFDYYPGGDVMANLGKMKVSVRERATTCDPYRPDCDQTWQKPKFAETFFDQYEFFLSPSWRYSDRQKPIKVLSPTHWQKDGGFLLPGAGELACRFVSDPNFNLECSIADDDMRFNLWRDRYSEYEDYTRLPTIQARITQECFWMKTTGGYDIHGIGRLGSYVQRMGREVVISVHANPVFLKP